MSPGGGAKVEPAGSATRGAGAPTSRLALEYVLPLRWAAGTDPTELTGYLRELGGTVDVTVVDGSEPEVWLRHHALWAGLVRHVRPAPWPGRNGKVAGVVTGVRLARHERVVIADDDVRWTTGSLQRAAAGLADADLVRPQNHFDPAPWHARWDTARTLLNRALGADHPGTYALRRSTFCAMGGYDGDVLFENLELARTVAAWSGTELSVPDLFVRRLPPTTDHFWGQRVRQAYDDLAEPQRLAVEAALLPLTAALLVRSARPGRGRTAARTGLVLEVVLPVLLAEVGRRRKGGRQVYRSSAALWAPAWLAERTTCIWLALACRAAGGVPYAGQRLITAAHRPATLRTRLQGDAGRRPLRPLSVADLPPAPCG